jgi:uncharacterized membrane protein
VDVTQWTTRVAQSFDLVGAAILVVGFFWSIALAARTWRTTGGADGYRRLRTTFGRTVLLGLEVLVAADLIRTVAVAPSLQNVVVLAIIVAIRTFLSFSLEVEIEGSLPWRRTAGRAPSRQLTTPSSDR